MNELPPDDFGWFTLPDLNLLYAAVNNLPEPSSVVLVGGQSLSLWADYFRIDVPVQETAYLTQDADFLGTHRDADLLARLLGAKIHKATLDDNTPNLAVLAFKGVGGKNLLIDFLSVIIGVDENSIRKRAISVVFQDRLVRVLHPLLCLKSRIENLKALPAKRNGNGISQARVAVEVAKRYIEERLKEGPEREAIYAAKQLREMALTPAGVYVFHHYQIDVLDAVVPEIFKTELFRTRDWPKAREWAARRRQKYREKQPV